MAKVRRCDLCGDHYPVKVLLEKRKDEMPGKYVHPINLTIKKAGKDSLFKSKKHLCHACTLKIQEMFSDLEADTFESED